MQTKAIFLTTLLLCICMQPANAQVKPGAKFTTMIVYDLNFVGDTLDPGRIIKEQSFLFVNGDSISLSESAANFVVNGEGNARKIERAESGLSYLPGQYLKTPDRIITYSSLSERKDETGDIFYTYEETDPFCWSLLPDTANVQGYQCQKAVCEYGGRKWEAWFATAIPISNGPYKFQGLPGLIVQISDAKQEWNFRLNAIETPNEGIVVPNLAYDAYRKTSRSDFLNKKRYFQKNYVEIQEASGLNFMNPENRAIIKNNVEMAFRQISNWIEL